MLAGRAVHVSEAQVDQVRKRNQRAADTDYGRVPRIGVIHAREYANNEQQDSRNEKQEGAVAAMPAQTEHHADRGQHDGKTDEYLLERMPRQKTETECWQDSEYQRQQGAMDRADHRGKRTDSIHAAAQICCAWRGLSRGVIHGSGKNRIHRVAQQSAASVNGVLPYNIIDPATLLPNGLRAIRMPMRSGNWLVRASRADAVDFKSLASRREAALMGLRIEQRRDLVVTDLDCT